MQVTRDGEVLEAPPASGRKARAVRIGGELVTVPPRPEGQPRRLAWPLIEPIYRSLCKKTGAAFATDETVRAMAWQDTGHVFGERTIARARRREAKRGTITTQRIRPNRFAGTKRTYGGSNRVRFPDLAAKRKGRWVEKTEQRKRRRELAAATATAAREAAQQEETRRARELAAERRERRDRRVTALQAEGPQPFIEDPEQTRAKDALAHPVESRQHVGTTLAAIAELEAAALRGLQHGSKAAKERGAEGAAGHSADVEARRAEVERQKRALREAGFELPADKPPDE